MPITAPSVGAPPVGVVGTVLLAGAEYSSDLLAGSKMDLPKVGVVFAAS